LDCFLLKFIFIAFTLSASEIYALCEEELSKANIPIALEYINLKIEIIFSIIYLLNKNKLIFNFNYNL